MGPPTGWRPGRRRPPGRGRCRSADRPTGSSPRTPSTRRGAHAFEALPRGRPWEAHRSVGRTGPPSDLRTGTLRANMWPRLSIVAGLLTGIAAAALVLGGILLLAPKPGAAPPPTAQSLTPAPASPSASASA